ncbi:dTDP-4-dehydrorhamnose 3,5-epimerase family protein [Candidatus Pacearchaeota archaeon]|nr:dTDP-4-dehydrorhamnose 3,5-epimerase family protein [Candidatus Pacearchaeota archaeon]
MEIEIKNLKIFGDDKGYLFEGLRADDKLFNGEFGQCLISVLYPGVIKGLHKHSKQIDYTCCIKGNLKYVLVKEGENGIETKIITLGEKNPILIKTTPGLWHGYMALDKEAIVLHVMNKPYKINEDDTKRLDPYHFGDLWSKKDN